MTTQTPTQYNLTLKGRYHLLDGPAGLNAIYSGLRGDDLTFIARASAGATRTGATLLEISVNSNDIVLSDRPPFISLNHEGIKGLTNQGYHYEVLPDNNPLLLSDGESGVLKALAEAKL